MRNRTFDFTIFFGLRQPIVKVGGVKCFGQKYLKKNIQSEKGSQRAIGDIVWPPEKVRELPEKVRELPEILSNLSEILSKLSEKVSEQPEKVSEEQEK